MDTTLNLIPGMTAEVGILCDLSAGGRGLGAFVYNKASLSYKGQQHDVVNGWIVEDKNVGSIESAGKKPAVYYTHKKPEKNTLCLFDYRGKLISAVHIIAIPIHDHSSIVQGGPAYATYFSDDESIE